jgi:hypothetical protein
MEEPRDRSPSEEPPFKKPRVEVVAGEDKRGVIGDGNNVSEDYDSEADDEEEEGEAEGEEEEEEETKPRQRKRVLVEDSSSEAEEEEEEDSTLYCVMCPGDLKLGHKHYTTLEGGTAKPKQLRSLLATALPPTSLELVKSVVTLFQSAKSRSTRTRPGPAHLLRVPVVCVPW